MFTLLFDLLKQDGMIKLNLPHTIKSEHEKMANAISTAKSLNQTINLPKLQES